MMAMKLVTPKRDWRIDAMLSIKRRHSPLHAVSAACTAALKQMVDIIPITHAQGLQAEVDAVHAALANLHEAAKKKWEAIE